MQEHRPDPLPQLRHSVPPPEYLQPGRPLFLPIRWCPLGKPISPLFQDSVLVQFPEVFVPTPIHVARMSDINARCTNIPCRSRSAIRPMGRYYSYYDETPHVQGIQRDAKVHQIPPLPESHGNWKLRSLMYRSVAGSWSKPATVAPRRIIKRDDEKGMKSGPATNQRVVSSL
jgi:hypothetical protein